MQNGIIETSSGDLLKAGNTDFLLDSSYDPSIHSIRNDVPDDATVRGDDLFTTYHRWNGDSWVTVSQVTKIDSGRAPVGVFSRSKLIYATTNTINVGEVGIKSEVRDSANKYSISWTGVLTGDLSVSGVGGLDTGSEAVSTWYAVYVISDTIGKNNPAILFSTNQSTPSLPSGYDIFRRVGWIKNDGLGNLIPFEQSGHDTSRRYFYRTNRDDTAVLVNGSNTSWTTIDTTHFLPPGIRHILLRISLSTKNITDLVQFRASGSLEVTPVTYLSAGSKNTEGYTGFIEMLAGTNRMIDYQYVSGAVAGSGAGGGSTGSQSVTVHVVGFSDEL